MSVRPSARPSVHKKFFRFRWNLVPYVGRGRWVMHDGMPYDPIQGQGLGHETFKVKNSSIFFNFSKSISSSIFNLSWQMTTDCEITEQYLTFVWSRFFDICPSFCVTWLRSWNGVTLSSLQMLLQLQLHSLGGGGVRRRPQSRTGLIFTTSLAFCLSRYSGLSNIIPRFPSFNCILWKC